MVYEQHRLAAPLNHEYSTPQPRMMIRQVEDIIGRSITLEEWNGLS